MARITGNQFVTLMISDNELVILCDTVGLSYEGKGGREVMRGMDGKLVGTVERSYADRYRVVLAMEVLLNCILSKDIVRMENISLVGAVGSVGSVGGVL